MGDLTAPALLALFSVYFGLIFTRGRLWGKPAQPAKPRSAAQIQLFWSAMLFLQYGLSALIGLALLGRGIGFPAEFAPLSPGDGRLPMTILVALMPLAMVAGFFASRRRARLGRKAVASSPLPDPRTGARSGRLCCSRQAPRSAKS